MSNGKTGGDQWKTIVAILALIGVTGASWVGINSTVSAQGRDIDAACKSIAKSEAMTDARINKVEARLGVTERESGETRGDIKEIKAILQRMEDARNEERYRERMARP